MVEFSAALKAGHATASGVPQSTQHLPFVLFDGDEGVCLTESGMIVPVDVDQVATFVLGLL